MQVRPAEYAAPSGETIRRNEVPYDGYRAVPAESGGGPAQPAVRAPRKAKTTDGAVDPDQIPF